MTADSPPPPLPEITSITQIQVEIVKSRQVLNKDLLYFPVAGHWQNIVMAEPLPLTSAKQWVAGGHTHLGFLGCFSRMNNPCTHGRQSHSEHFHL